MPARAVRVSYLFAALVIGASRLHAADLNVCEALPVATVNAITRQALSGTRSDGSPEAHSYGCAYGKQGLVSVSVIRPGGGAAVSRTKSQLKAAQPVAGIGDQAFYASEVGTIAQFGDVAIAAFLPKGNLSDDEIKAMERSLILAMQKKL